MSEELGGSSAGDAARGLQRDISNAVGQLGVGEKFAVLGSLAVLVVWGLMDLLIDRYSIGHLPFALALVVVYSAYRYHMAKAAAWAIPYSTVVFASARRSSGYSGCGRWSRRCETTSSTRAARR